MSTTSFKAGDRVRITEGDHAGRAGTVIQNPWRASGTQPAHPLALRVDAEAGQSRPGPDGVARGGRGGFVCDVDRYKLVPR